MRLANLPICLIGIKDRLFQMIETAGEDDHLGRFD
jgi:hypothetical protein